MYRSGWTISIVLMCKIHQAGFYLSVYKGWTISQQITSPGIVFFLPPLAFQESQSAIQDIKQKVFMFPQVKKSIFIAARGQFGLE